MGRGPGAPAALRGGGGGGAGRVGREGAAPDARAHTAHVEAAFPSRVRTARSRGSPAAPALALAARLCGCGPEGSPAVSSPAPSGGREREAITARKLQVSSWAPREAQGPGDTREALVTRGEKTSSPWFDRTGPWALGGGGALAQGIRCPLAPDGSTTRCRPLAPALSSAREGLWAVADGDKPLWFLCDCV